MLKNGASSNDIVGQKPHRSKTKHNTLAQTPTTVVDRSTTTAGGSYGPAQHAHHNIDVFVSWYRSCPRLHRRRYNRCSSRQHRYAQQRERSSRQQYTHNKQKSRIHSRWDAMHRQTWRVAMQTGNIEKRLSISNGRTDANTKLCRFGTSTSSRFGKGLQCMYAIHSGRNGQTRDREGNKPTPTRCPSIVVSSLTPRSPHTTDEYSLQHRQGRRDGERVTQVYLATILRGHLTTLSTRFDILGAKSVLLFAPISKPDMTSKKTLTRTTRRRNRGRARPQTTGSRRENEDRGEVEA